MAGSSITDDIRKIAQPDHYGYANLPGKKLQLTRYETSYMFTFFMQVQRINAS